MLNDLSCCRCICLKKLAPRLKPTVSFQVRNRRETASHNPQSDRAVVDLCLQKSLRHASKNCSTKEMEVTSSFLKTQNVCVNAVFFSFLTALPPFGKKKKPKKKKCSTKLTEKKLPVKSKTTILRLQVPYTKSFKVMNLVFFKR